MADVIAWTKEAFWWRWLVNCGIVFIRSVELPVAETLKANELKILMIQFYHEPIVTQGVSSYTP